MSIRTNWPPAAMMSGSLDEVIAALQRVVQVQVIRQQVAVAARHLIRVLIPYEVLVMPRAEVLQARSGR